MYNKYLKKVFLTLAFTLSIFTGLHAADDFIIEETPVAIEIAAALPHSGELKQKDNGYVYVDVSNDFINLLFPIIEQHIKEEHPDAKVVPPPFLSKKGIGAHISVMYETDIVKNDIWNIPELGKEYTFTIREIRSVKILGQKPKKLWLLAVDAPDLETLRESYGLSSKLKGHDFHITIAYQKPGKDKGMIQEEMEFYFYLEDFPEAA
jgi:hypothetical protein